MWRVGLAVAWLAVVACSSGSSGTGGPAPPPDGADEEMDASPPPRPPDAVAPGMDAALEADGVATPIGEDAAPHPDAAPPAVDGPPAPLGDFPLTAALAAKPELFAGLSARVEGPSWRNGEVIFAADGVGMMRADAQGKVYKFFPTLNPVGSFALADGSLLVCEKKYILLQLFPDDTLGIIVGEGAAAGFCNDITVDADGNIYFSESRMGAIMKVTPAGQLSRFLGGRSYTNGVEIDRENKFLYFSDTGNNTLYRAPLAGGAAESLGGMIADGMAIDAWGNLWLAQVTAGQGIIYDPTRRQILGRVGLGGPQATNLVFGGPARDTLFATVASKGIMRIPVGVRGFSHPGAAKYALQGMLDLKPANTPVN
jgi:sugar lactone lactonase YvrE